jgi:hypothetical protein
MNGKCVLMVGKNTKRGPAAASHRSNASNLASVY